MQLFNSHQNVLKQHQGVLLIKVDYFAHGLIESGLESWLEEVPDSAIVQLHLVEHELNEGVLVFP